MLERLVRGCVLVGLALMPIDAAPAGPDLAARIAQLGRDYPALLEARARGDAIGVRSFDSNRFSDLLDEIRAGRWDARHENALWVVFSVFSQEQALLAVEGRGLLHEAVGAALASGRLRVLEGMTAVLVAIMEDATSQYSVLAQELLSAKLRCAAVSLGDAPLLEAINERVAPERELRAAAPRAPVQGRWPLHPRADLYDVAARGDQVVAVGAFGTVLVSNDAGGSWSPAQTRSDETLLAVSHGSGQEVWVVGRAGTVLYSADRGQSFAVRASPFDRHLFGVYASGPGRALLVGDYGLQLRAEDAGRRWSCLPRVDDVILGRIVRAGADAFLVGEFGTLERWPARGGPPVAGRVEGQPRDPYLFDVWFDASGRVGLAVGVAGTLLRSADGGLTWRRIELAFDGDLYALGGVGDLVVIAGEGGFLSVSRDRGKRFMRAGLEIPALPLLAVDFADPARGYVVGGRGLILATDDAAQSFRVVHSGWRR